MLDVFLMLATFTNVGDPPTDAYILRAMPKIARGTPPVYEEFRDNIVILKNRLSSRVLAVPLHGGATVNVVTDHWECVVYFDHVTQSEYPFPIRVKKPRVMVIYADVLNPQRIEKIDTRY